VGGSRRTVKICVNFIVNWLRWLRACSLSLALFALGTSPALAQSTLPTFSCDGNVWQVQSGQLKIFNPVNSTYTNIGPQQPGPTYYNATGYNKNDDYAYGITGNSLIRIGGNGVFEVPVPNLGFTSNSADVDDANNLWARTGPLTLRKISLLASTVPPYEVTTVPLTGPGFTTADVTFVTNAGKKYLLGIETGSATLSRVNISDNEVTQDAITGLPAAGYGAIWRDSANRLFAFNNTTGGIYEIFNYFTSTPSAVLVAQGASSGNNDGFSCFDAPFPNLQPLAFPDFFTTPFETNVVGNVIADNDTTNANGPDRDPENTPLTVTTTPTVGPTNGSVVLAANGNFTYTPNANFVGTDTFTYQLNDASGRTDTAVVQIIVSPPSANLVTVKTISSANATPAVGETVTFSIVVTNTSPGGVAPNVTLTDQLPAGMTYTTNSVTQGSYAPATGVWTIGRINNGQSATLLLSGTVNAGQAGNTLTNTTTAATGSNADTNNTGNDLTETITVANASHSIVKTQTSGPNPVTARGQVIGYQIAVANTGNVNLTGIVLTDTLALGAAPRTLTSGPTFASGNPNGNTRIDVGETWIYTASYTVTQADLDGAGTFSNTATIDTTQTTPLTSAAVVTGVTRTPALTIDKIPSTLGPVNANDTITYTYNVTNTGNVTISGIQVTDNHNGTNSFPTPSGEALVLPEAAPTGDSTDATPGNAQWTTLAPGDTVRFTANYQVNQTDIDTLQ
jgi:large repetitive protein